MALAEIYLTTNLVPKLLYIYS